ncbi:hypothetical protein [Pseudoalteromonas sp. GB56]
MARFFLLILTLCSCLAYGQDAIVVEQLGKKEYSDPHLSSSYPRKPTVFNNAVYFIASDGGIDEKRHLFLVNPETNEHSLVMLEPDVPTANVTQLKPFANKLYFQQDGQVYSISNLNEVSLEPTELNFVFDVEHFANFENSTFFVADFGLGEELYEFQNNEVTLVKDFNTGGDDGVTSSLLALGDVLYFGANNGTSANLYSYSVNTASFEQLTHLDSTVSTRIYDITAKDGFFYFDALGEGDDESRIFKSNGSSTEKIYTTQGLYLAKMEIVQNTLVIGGTRLGYEVEGCGVEFGASLIFIDLDTLEPACISAFDYYDGGVDAANFITGDDKVIFEYRRYRYPNYESRWISQVDVKTRELSNIYFGYYCLADECNVDTSMVIANGSLYFSVNATASNGLGDGRGVELVSTNLDTNKTSLIDVNSDSSGKSASLRLLKAVKNILFVEPYLLESERNTYSRHMLQFDYTTQEFVNTKVAFPYAPEAAYLHGEVIHTEEGGWNENYYSPTKTYMSVFSHNGSLYSLYASRSQDDEDTPFWLKHRRTQLQIKEGIPESSFHLKGISGVGFKANTGMKKVVHDAKLRDDYLFLVSYHVGNERLYRFNFNDETSTLIDIFEPDIILSMFEANDSAFIIKRSKSGIGIFQVENDQLLFKASLSEFNESIGVHKANDSIYFVGKQTSSETESILAFSTLEHTITSVLDNKAQANYQSLAYFDGHIFYVNQESTTSKLYQYDTVNSELSEVALGSNITQPLDVITYYKGIAFQAKDHNNVSALYSLSFEGQNELPDAKYSEAIGNAMQAHLYESSFIVDSDIQVYVTSPRWLSYNQSLSQVEGTPVSEYHLFNYETGRQAAHIVIDDGQMLNSYSYEIMVDKVLRLERGWDNNPHARRELDAGTPFSYQVRLIDNADTGDSLEFALTASIYGSYTSSGEDEVQDWVSIDPDTGLIEGTPPEFDEAKAGGIEVTVTKGPAFYREYYSFIVLPSETVDEQETEEESGGAIWLLLGLLTLVHTIKIGRSKALKMKKITY